MANRRTTRTVRRTGPRRKRIWSRQTRLEIILDSGAYNPLKYSLTEAYRTERDIGVMDPGCTVAGLIVNYQFVASGGLAATTYGADAAVVWGVVAGGYSAPPTTFTNAPPDPLDQPNEDWMFWEHTAIPPGATITHSSSSTAQGGRGTGPVMIRAKRKLDELGDDVFLCASLDPAAFGGSTDVSVYFTTSTLFPLP